MAAWLSEIKKKVEMIRISAEYASPDRLPQPAFCPKNPLFGKCLFPFLIFMADNVLFA
jgi:hypothetical protein